MKRLVFALLLGGWIAAAVGAEEPRFSGPQPGEPVTPFKVLQVSSPEKTEVIEVAGDKESGPMLLVFAHQISEPALGLMITLEWYANKHRSLSDHYVLLTDDRLATETQVKRWAQRPFLAGAHLCVGLDGPEGPGAYGLNRNVDMTVLVVNDHKVVANFALLSPGLEEAPRILVEVAKVLGQPVPSIETIREELRVERERKRGARLAENPVYKLAPDAQLGRLMMQMLYREGNTEAYIREAADDLRNWANNDAKKQQLTTYCRAILDGKFEMSAAARRAVRELGGVPDP